MDPHHLEQAETTINSNRVLMATTDRIETELVLWSP
jgi:hypothetical protein